jgi:protein SCO1/2
MNNTPTISNNKIIIFVVFICAALMSSLFIYHASQKQMQPLPENVGMTFSAPRDIKSFSLLTEADQAYTEKNFRGHWTLLFFGFTHCANICPTTLDVLNRVYTKLKPTISNLQVSLISVDPERDTPSILANYVHSYNSEFRGVTGKISELRKLQSQLGIYSARDEQSGNDYQVQHTSSILLINPQGKWAGLFKYGLPPEVLTDGIQKAIRALR